MSTIVDLLSGEIERLFSTSEMKALCIDYLDMDPAAAGIEDATKSIFARKIVDYCNRENAIEALTDVVTTLKRGSTDLRLQQIYGKGLTKTDFKPGAKVGGVIIEAPVGKDVLGKYYRCLGDEDEKTYMLLILGARFTHHRRLAQRFVALMRLLKSDKTPGIQAVVNTGITEDGRGFVIVEWVDAPPLSEKVPLTIRGALTFFEALLDTLAPIHEKGIVHGNLNSENVLAEGDDDRLSPVLVGFGTDRLMETAVIGLGVAPEQTRQQRADVRSDIYALGALFYEMLAGAPPFRGNHIIDAVAHHVVADLPPLSEKLDDPGAAAFDKFIGYLTAKEPTARPKDIDQVRRKLEDVKRRVEQLQAQAASTGTREHIADAIARFISAPTDDTALTGLLNDGRAANAWGPVVEVLEEVAAGLNDPAVVRKLLLISADLANKRLKNYAKSLSLYEYLLSLNPADEEALQLTLETLQAAGRYEALLERLAARAEQLTEPAERLDVLKRMAFLYEKKIKDLEKAFTYYVACLTGTEADKELLPSLETLAEKTNQFESLASSLGEAAQVAETNGDVETTLFFYEKLGDYYLNKLEQPAYALSCFQKIYELRPGDEEALKAIADLYRGAQQWPELAQITMQLAEAEAQPAIRRSHMVEAADIYYHRLGNSDQAYSLLDAVLSEDPGNKKALDIMTAIIEASGDTQRLAKLLSDSLDAISDDQEQLSVRCRLGKICEEQLGDLAEAKRHYENALAVDPQFFDALKGLDRIYTKEGNAVALRNNLDTQLECPTITPKQKAEILQRLADLSEEEFKEVDKAIMYLEALLETDETHRYAMVTLTRLYRRQERWDELVDLLEKRAKTALDDEKKALLKERAEIIKDKLKDAARAIEALTEVTSLGVDEALETLAKTQEDSGDYTAAVETLQKIAAAAPDYMVRLSVMARIAMIEFEKLGAVDDAILTLRKARDINPNDRALLGIYGKVMVAKRNFAEALGAMEQEVALETGVSARAEILAQMGLVCMMHLNDAERAIGYFKAAIDLEEGNFTAGFNLLRLYRQLGNTEDAIPLYRRWKDSVDTIDPENRLIFLSDMGDVYAADKRIDEAYKAYAKAVSIEGIVVPADLLLKYADAAFRTDQTAGVAEQIQLYLQNAGDTLDQAVQESLQVALAKAYLMQKNVVEANKLLRHLLNSSPKNTEARALLADVQEERGDFRQMVESLMEVISALPKDDMQRVEYMRRAAVVMFERLRDSDGAVKLLKKALEISDNDRTILAELLKIHTSSKNFNELVDVILRIAEQVQDPAQKVRYYVSAAKVYRREIGNLKKAVQYFEMALELSPTDKDANKAIVETLEQNMAWDKLEGHYKKQIARLPKDASKDDKLAVYRPLFELLAKKLKKKDDALVIGEAITKLAPEDQAHAEILADMYGWDAKYADKAVALHRRLLEKNAARAESVRQLYRIFSAQGNPDRTWCAASVLSLLNACTPEELKYYKDYKPTDLQTFANVLDGDHWYRKLLPSEMDKTITSIFSIVQDVIFRTKGQPLSRYGIDMSQSIDVTQTQYTAGAFVNFAAGTLGLAPPPFFFLQGAAPGYQLLETNPPVLISDGNEAALADRVATIFALGQQLALFYPGLFISEMITSGRELLSWLLASIRIFAPQLPVPDDIAGSVSDKLTPIRSALDDAAMERLQGHVHTFISTSSNEVNLKKWAKTVTYAQDRAGLLLCGDLAVAVKVLRNEEKDEKRLADRLRAITLFAVSTEHYELRSHLGSALRSA